MDRKAIQVALLVVLLVSPNCVLGAGKSDKDKNEDEGIWSFCKSVAAGGVGATTLATVGTKALGVLGFGAAGIVPSSIAATIQSWFGAGAVFAALQSTAMTGGVAILGPVGIAGGVAGAAAYHYYSSENEESSSK